MCCSNLLLPAVAESGRVCSDIVTVVQDPVMCHHLKLSVHDVFLYLEVEFNPLLKMSKVFYAHMFHNKGRISAVILVEVTHSGVISNTSVDTDCSSVSYWKLWK